MKRTTIRDFYDHYYSASALEPKPPPDPPNLQRYKERYKTMLLEQVAANLKPCSLVLDAGCGNGINLFGVVEEAHNLPLSDQAVFPEYCFTFSLMFSYITLLALRINQGDGL